MAHTTLLEISEVAGQINRISSGSYRILGLVYKELNSWVGGGGCGGVKERYKLTFSASSL